MLDWMIPAAGLAGAMLVAAANYAVQRWRYRLDRTSASVDYLCGEVNSTADMSTEYWLLDATQIELQKKAWTLEPQLIGRQMRLQSLVLALADLDSKLVLTRTNMLMLELYEVLTGGDFKVAGHALSRERAQEVQATAARINGELRHAVSLRSHLWF